MPSLEARAQEQLCYSTTLPYVSLEERKEYMSELHRSSRACFLQEDTMPPPVIKRDPEEAAAWFKARGVKVSRNRN
jgi:hypothetical protein